MSKKPTTNKKLQQVGTKGFSADRRNGPDLEQLERVFELMGRHGVSELEWQSGDDRIQVRQGGAAPAPVVIHSPLPASPRVEGSGSGSQAIAPQTPPASGRAAATGGHHRILSPFVGTFYRAPSPTSDPYVKEGQTIKKGETLCVIEAMKLMNEIESEISGRVVSILVENGQPVEFGEALFEVSLSG